ncbi:MAG: N-acetyl-gamma-glutamyl-phosphate reductase, partial [Elusimicrobiota bacterium]
MKQKIRAGIIGITGYTGEELLKILVRHPHASVTALQGRSAAEVRSLKDIYAHFADLKLSCEGLDIARLVSSCDVVFLALPHTVSFEIAPALVSAGVKVIDLSADFRISDKKTYEQWYAKFHTAHDLLSLAVYGLPELYRKKLVAATLVANPGCYPTSVILGCLPVLSAGGIVDAASIIVDAKSGISGAGRKTAAAYFETEHPNFRPYNIAGGHRHLPEIEQELTALAGSSVPLKITFTPHIMPIERGMISTIYM